MPKPQRFLRRLNIGSCLASAKVLGDQMSEAAAGFLTWRIPRTPDCSCSDRLLLQLGLLILATRLRSARLSDAALGNAAEWLLQEERHYRQSFPSYAVEPGSVAFSVQSGLWKPLAVELSDEAATIGVEAVRSDLELCALLVDPS
jgi:hypothetical protein